MIPGNLLFFEEIELEKDNGLVAQLNGA